MNNNTSNKGFVTNILSNSFQEVVLHYDVEKLLNDMLSTIEMCYSENECRIVKRDLIFSNKKTEKLEELVNELETEKDILSKKLLKIKDNAKDVREKFSLDIGEVLTLSRCMEKMKSTIKELELKITNSANVEKELLEAQELIKTFKSSSSSNISVSCDSNSIKEENGNEETISTLSEPMEGLVSIPPKKENDTIETIITPIKEEVIAIILPTIYKPRKYYNFLSELEDDLLLQLFSFLNTKEVLHAAEVSRYVFKRVDKLFGIESSLVVDSWGIKPIESTDEVITDIKNDQNNSTNITTELSSPLPVVTTQKVDSSWGPSSWASGLAAVVGAGTSVVPNIVTTNSITNSLTNATLQGGGLTLEMADELSKKLNAVELKAIIGLSEKLKKQTSLLAEAETQKDDLITKLQNDENVRDFLVSNLKNAEKAIKLHMNNVTMVKKQSNADQEIIGFLDLKVLDLESKNKDFSKKCEQLQASYALQSRSHNLTEQNLKTELFGYKSKCDEFETSYKTQKKLLVKEVKSLRHQVETLSIEKNRYYTQLQTLKDAFNVADAISMNVTASSVTFSSKSDLSSSNSSSNNGNNQKGTEQNIKKQMIKQPLFL
jgi:hypothetical protein